MSGPDEQEVNLEPTRIRYLELTRISGVPVERLERSLEAHLPKERTERISLFPSWPQGLRSHLLAGILSQLESSGLTGASYVKPGPRKTAVSARGPAAREQYLGDANEDVPAWPRAALLLRSNNAQGAAIASDLDGDTLFVDLWGADAAGTGDQLFSHIWAETRQAR